MEHVTLHDENFWPSINQTADGEIYVVDGSHTCLFRLDGLESLCPIPRTNLEVTAADLRSAQIHVEQREAARQKVQGSGVLRAAILAKGPKVDGHLDDWANADWVEIDRRGDGANFNSNAKPYNVLGAIAADETRLYAAWDTQNAKTARQLGRGSERLVKVRRWPGRDDRRRDDGQSASPRAGRGGRATARHAGRRSHAGAVLPGRGARHGGRRQGAVLVPPSGVSSSIGSTTSASWSTSPPTARAGTSCRFRSSHSACGPSPV